MSDSIDIIIKKIIKDLGGPRIPAQIIHKGPGLFEFLDGSNEIPYNSMDLFTKELEKFWCDDPSLMGQVIHKIKRDLRHMAERDDYKRWKLWGTGGRIALSLSQHKESIYGHV